MKKSARIIRNVTSARPAIYEKYCLNMFYSVLFPMLF